LKEAEKVKSWLQEKETLQKKYDAFYHSAFMPYKSLENGT
jgi:hypothetical protein